MRYAAAIGLWVLAWACAALAVTGILAARNGRRGAAAEVAAGIAGAAGLAYAGAVTW